MVRNSQQYKKNNTNLLFCLISYICKQRCHFHIFPFFFFPCRFSNIRLQVAKVQTFVLIKIGFANTFKLIESLKELVRLYCYLWPFVLPLQCFCLYWHEYLHGQTVNQIRELIRVETNLARQKKSCCLFSFPHPCLCKGGKVTREYE